jgi:hypothetical protein
MAMRALDAQRGNAVTRTRQDSSCTSIDARTHMPPNNRMNPTKPAMASGARASRVIRVFGGHEEMS